MLPLGAVIFILKFFVSHLTQKFRRYLDKFVIFRVNWIKISFFLEPFGELKGGGGDSCVNSNNFPIFGDFLGQIFNVTK
jgi:hypothetical protein